MINTEHIKSAAHSVAEAETHVAEATAAHAAAVAHADEIRIRIQVIRDHRAVIRADLAAGKLTAKEAGGLTSIAADDEADLIEIFKDAEAAVNAAANAVAESNNVHGAAINALEQSATRAEFDALAAHVSSLEKLLSDAVGELFGLGMTLGLPRSLSSVWRPSQALQRAIIQQVPPPRSGI